MKRMPRSLKPIQVLNVIAFIAMIAVNALATTLPINGVTTAQASDALPNLFTPAGLTFSVWGVIYLLLFAFVIYQTGLLNRRGEDPLDAVRRLGAFFIISSAFNIAWIFAWHYGLFALSVVCMLGLLISLIVAFRRIALGSLSLTERILVRAPFAVYFGWITVATIANISAFLVSLGFEPFGLSAEISTVVILIVGMAIGLSVVLGMRAPAYGLVMTWAYLGIVIKHASPAGFGMAYPAVIATAAVCAAVLLVASLVVLIKRRSPDSVVATEAPLS